MNIKQLTSKIGELYRFRPLPRRIDADGTVLPTLDDSWRLDEVLSSPNRIRLTNTSTGHSLELFADSVKEFRHPDFLLLRCQIDMSPTTVSYEPIIGPGPELTDSTDGGVRLSGTPAALLQRCIKIQSSQLWELADATSAIAELSLSPEEYRHAAEELATLGLVTIHWDANSVSGIIRISLEPSVYLEVAPQLDIAIDVAAEVGEILRFASRTDPNGRFRTTDLLEAVAIPLARLDLTLRALEDLGYIVGHGPGSHEWGSSLDYSITASGRRLIRGEETLF